MSDFSSFIFSLTVFFFFSIIAICDLKLLMFPVYPGRSRKDASFNLGVGCSLLYLVAASKNELTKMVELRKQVETLLLNVKEELKRKDPQFKAFESNFTAAYSTSDVLEGPNSNSRVSRQSQTTSYVLPISETTMMHDQSLKCNSPQQEEYLEGMDGLEAEIEAEWERLQISLERENSLKHTRQQKTKVSGKCGNHHITLQTNFNVNHR